MGARMKVKCDFCENYFEDTESGCPYCGAVNSAAGNRRFSNGVPKTIEELKEWVEKNNVPLDKVPVYIGVNGAQPKCIGIYREGGEVIVYKNKADGTRAIRYQGSDEAYAVNEVYLKIKEMMAMATATNRTPSSNSSNSRNTSYSGYSGYQSSNRNSYKWNNRPNRISLNSSRIGGIALIVILVVLLVAFPSCTENIGQIIHSYGAGYSSSDYNWNYNSGYGYGYESHTSNWDYDYSDDSDDSWDFDYDWDSDWDSDYGDYDWDFDYDWDSDW